MFTSSVALIRLSLAAEADYACKSLIRSTRLRLDLA
jgi:hypothetical protein